MSQDTNYPDPPAPAISSPTPLLGVVAYSGTGKTTLLKKLIPILKQRGLRIAVVKHAHHEFDIDTPGKDSYEVRKAGATQTLVASGQRWALMTETADTAAQDPDLNLLLQQLDHDRLDLILIEGFKHQHFAKIVLHRSGLERPILFSEDHAEDHSVIAVATDNTAPDSAVALAIAQRTDIRLLDINNPLQIADFAQQLIAAPVKI